MRKHLNYKRKIDSIGYFI